MDVLPGTPCKGVSRQDFFQHIKAIRISDWHFKGVSRQDFFQNLKATRPRKARTQNTMSPYPRPRKSLLSPHHRYPSMLPLLSHCGAICTLQCNKIGFFTLQSLSYYFVIRALLRSNLNHFRRQSIAFFLF